MPASICARRWMVGFSGAVVLLLSDHWLASGFLVTPALAEANAVEQDEFAAQLATGEFSNARRRIDETPAAERDQMLVQLANAQAGVGAREAAYSTLSSVGDDRVRNSGVQSVRNGGNGAAGGATANFDALIDLITSTVKPTTWDEVGGPGSISEFRNGVYVDPAGVLQRSLKPKQARGLAAERLAALEAAENTDSRRSSALRKVSLTRLEKHVQLSLAAGRPLDPAMTHLAGLEKIRYVLVYPETGDLVLAGPASDWRVDDEGRHVSRKSGRPILQLDDLVVVLRYLTANAGGTFGCSIEPTQEGLARTRDFAEQSSAKPLKPGQRPAWLKQLQSQMGRQTIVVDGLDPRTRAARVLVEADYRMKLVGMGLEAGTVDVPSYLDLIRVGRNQAPPALDVLRWWFTLKYDAVQATETRDAFEIQGAGVQVLSENEMLDHLGRRIHTGKSEALNQEFAQRFTQHFAALADKYPVYADLQNIFDLALVSALIQSEHLPDRVGWHLTCFNDAEQYQVALGPAPQSVETVVGHRVVNQKHVIVGVSGGVHVAPAGYVRRDAVSTDNYGALRAARGQSTAGKLPPDAWWWD